MRRKHILLATFLTLSSLSLPCHTMAAVIGVAFEGRVDGVGLPIFEINPAIGSAVIGSFSYDTTLAPSISGSIFATSQVTTPYTLWRI